MEGNVIGVVHSGVAVKSLDVSIPFYRDLLGLELLGIEEPKKSRGDKLGVPGAYIQTAHFRIPDSHTEIELIEYKAPTPLLNYGVPVNTPGCVHIAWRVDNIEAIVDRLKAAGVAFVSEDYEEIHGGPIDGWKWIYLKDPDGTNMEIIEETKVRY